MTTAARKKRSLVDLGVVLAGCTLLWLMAFAFFVFLLVAGITTGESVDWNVAFTLVIFIAPAGYWLWQRYAAFFDVARDRALHIANPVVFLRPFAKDERKIERGFESILWLLFMGPLGRFWFGMLLRKTPEEQIERAAMQALGPMVALGSPQDRMPQTGALRVYAADDEWQEIVSLLVGRARAIFMMAGTTSALAWELRYLRTFAEPARVFIFTEPEGAPRDRWSAVQRNFEEAGWTLPASDVGPGGVIGFDNRWQPVVLADHTATPARLIAAVVSWMQAESRAACPCCSYVLGSAPCTRCAEPKPRPAGEGDPDAAAVVAMSDSARERLGERRSSVHFGAWILPLLGRFRFRGLRAGVGLLLVELSVVILIALHHRIAIAPFALFVLILAAFATPLMFAVWMLRRAPVRRVVREAKLRGVGAGVIDHLASVVDTRSAFIGPENGRRYQTAILLEAPLVSMHAMLEERAIRLRDSGAPADRMQRRREVIGGIAYDVVDIPSEDVAPRRYHFELTDLDTAVTFEEMLTADPAVDPEFLAEVVFPAIPIVHSAPGPRPMVKTLRGVLTVVASIGLVPLVGSIAIFIGVSWDKPIDFDAGHRWLLLWAIPPLLLVVCRSLARPHLVDWRRGWSALVDLQSEVRPSDARTAGGALIAVTALAVLAFAAGLIIDANARRELWKALESRRATATAALVAGDVGTFHSEMTDLTRRLDKIAAEGKINVEDVRERSTAWNRETRLLLVRHFDELVGKTVETHEDTTLQRVLSDLNMNDYAARVSAAAAVRRQRLASRGFHVKVIAEDGSDLDQRTVDMLSKPFIAALRQKLGTEWDVIVTPRADGEVFAADIDVRVNADVRRFSPSWWTGDAAGPSSVVPETVRSLFVAIPVYVRYTTSVADGKPPHPFEELKITVGPLPETNPRLDAMQQETTDTSEWMSEDAQGAAKRNLELLQQELVRSIRK